MKLQKTNKLPDAIARISAETYEWLLNHPKETFETLYKQISPCTVLSVTNLAWNLYPKQSALILCTNTIDKQFLFEYRFRLTPLKDSSGKTYREYLEPVGYELFLPEVPLIFIDDFSQSDETILNRIRNQGTSLKSFLICDPQQQSRKLTR